MRFDEINLIGDFKIQGLTGDSGKAIGFSGSNIEWIDAASGGTPANALSTSGYNYVIISATGSAVENGDTLRDVMDNLASYFNGTLTDDNRFTVLLMPGEYDMLNNSLVNGSDYVDIVGISSNPYDTVISRSDNGRVYRITSYDSGLYNLYFKNGYIEEGSTMTYMRWKNIVLGDGVFNGGYLLTDMIGEFEDITILGSCQFAHVTTSIDGIFNNINYIGTDSDGYFYSSAGTLTGTFSNITSTGNVTANIFYADTSISGNFEKIDLNSSGQGCFVTSGNMTGTYRDIKLKVQSGDSFGFASDDANTVFEDIEIGETNASNVFSNGTFNGKYKNINIGDAQSCFVTDSGFESTAKFENIQIKSSTADVFSSSSGDLNGTFENIKIGDVGANAFYSDAGDLYGTYENIEVGVVDGYFMVSLGNFVADVKNVTVALIGGQYAFHTIDSNTGYTFNANFSNIKAGNMPSNSSARIFGSRASGDNYNMILENIEVGDISGYFGTSGMNTTYTTASNVTVGNIGNSLFQGTKGNITNLKVGNVSGGIFTSAYSNTRLSNIKIGNIGAGAFTSNTSIPNYIYNLEIGNVTGNCFYVTGEIPAVSYDTIKVGNVSGNFIVATGTNGVIQSNTFKNIKVGNIGDSAFCAFYNFGSNFNVINNNTFKNIEIGSANQVFITDNFGSKVITNSTFDNITIGTCSTIFRGTVGSASVIRNLNVTGQFGTNTYGTFHGRIENSFINQIDRNVNLVSINDFARLERIKYLVHPTKTVNISTGRAITYNLFNYATILSSVYGSASNVIDADVSP